MTDSGTSIFPLSPSWEPAYEIHFRVRATDHNLARRLSASRLPASLLSDSCSSTGLRRIDHWLGSGLLGRHPSERRGDPDRCRKRPEVFRQNRLIGPLSAPRPAAKHVWHSNRGGRI